MSQIVHVLPISPIDEIAMHCNDYLIRVRSKGRTYICTRHGGLNIFAPSCSNQFLFKVFIKKKFIMKQRKRSETRMNQEILDARASLDFTLLSQSLDQWVVGLVGHWVVWPLGWLAGGLRNGRQ